MLTLKTTRRIGLAESWRLARENIGKAQEVKYDSERAEVDLKIGERVMVYMPIKTQGLDKKLARPFHSPYQVFSLTPTNAKVRLVDNPTLDPIFVSLDRVCCCYGYSTLQTISQTILVARCYFQHKSKLD